MLCSTPAQQGQASDMDSIVGGTSTKIEGIPYQVALNPFDDYNNKYTCGGAIIDETNILTSASCLEGYVYF